MQDAVQLETHGTPTVLICTDLFLTEARQVAAILGLSHLPVVQIPHPLSTLGEREIFERAQRALPALQKALTHPIEVNRLAPAL